MSPKNLLVGLALCLLVSLPAHAKLRLAIINTGDEMFEVASFPAEVVEQYPGASNLMAGYKCSRFGVFWANIWTWDCKLVAVIDEHTYSDLPQDITRKLAADPRYLLKKAKRSFWNQYAFWTLMATLFTIYLITRGKGDDRRSAARYA